MRSTENHHKLFNKTLNKFSNYAENPFKKVVFSSVIKMYPIDKLVQNQ